MITKWWWISTRGRRPVRGVSGTTSQKITDCPASNFRLRLRLNSIEEAECWVLAGPARHRRPPQALANRLLETANISEIPLPTMNRMKQHFIDFGRASECKHYCRHYCAKCYFQFVKEFIGTHGKSQRNLAGGRFPMACGGTELWSFLELRAIWYRNWKTSVV